jgi:hypothetical protein
VLVSSKNIFALYYLTIPVPSRNQQTNFHKSGDEFY